MYLTGEFEDMGAAITAIRQLKSNGFGPTDMDLFSDEPIELPRGVLDRPSRMSLMAVSGAVVFFLLIIGFVCFTQYDYKLVTGGMPTFSFWATGVVFYEITMLGAILSTFGWFIWESGLRRRDKRVPVPVVAAGLICIRVHCTPEQETHTDWTLKSAGALTVEKLGQAV